MEKSIKGAVPYLPHLYKHLQNSECAASYLKNCFEDGDQGVFLLALKDVVMARSSMTQLARDTGITREHLYVLFSKKGNPEWFTINKILHALGFQLSFQTPKPPKPKKASKKKTASERGQVHRPKNEDV